MNNVLEPQSESASTSVVAESAANTDGKWANGLEWSAVLWLGFLHLGVLAAPFHTLVPFDWARFLPGG